MDMASGDNLQGDSAKLHDWGKWNEVNDATGVAGKLSSRELYGLTTMRTWVQAPVMRVFTDCPFFALTDGVNTMPTDDNNDNLTNWLDFWNYT